MTTYLHHRLALLAAALLLAAVAGPHGAGQAAGKGATGATYLSEARWTGVRNGWGPVEKNMSNGENRKADGRVLTMNKKKYRSGFGCHAPSEIRVDLGGRYSTFLADIGFDDEARYPKPSAYVTRVIFKVFADGRQIFDSGPMTAKAATKAVRLPIGGKKQLRLVVAAMGAAPSSHINWADARVVK